MSKGKEENIARPDPQLLICRWKRKKPLVLARGFSEKNWICVFIKPANGPGVGELVKLQGVGLSGIELGIVSVDVDKTDIENIPKSIKHPSLGVSI
jgi:hypothetical protein